MSLRIVSILICMASAMSALAQQNQRNKESEAIFQEVSNLNNGHGITQHEHAKNVSQTIAKKKEATSRMVATISQKLSVMTRTRDPFGVPVEGGFNSMYAVREGENVVAEPSYVEAIRKLRITGVSPKLEQIVIGPRVVKSGEVVRIKFQGTVFDLKVIDVKAHSVVFQDAKTQQKASLTLNIIPKIGQYSN